RLRRSRWRAPRRRGPRLHLALIVASAATHARRRRRQGKPARPEGVGAPRWGPVPSREVARDARTGAAPLEDVARKRGSTSYAFRALPARRAFRALSARRAFRALPARRAFRALPARRAFRAHREGGRRARAVNGRGAGDSRGGAGGGRR